MKKMILLFLGLFILGCAYEGTSLKTYFENPRSLIKDPHFGEYKQKRDALESQYLKKEITYSEYVQKMDELDQAYAKEVQQRNQKISGE